MLAVLFMRWQWYIQKCQVIDIDSFRWVSPTYVFVSCIDIVLTTNADYNVYHVWVNLLFVRVNPACRFGEMQPDLIKFILISRIGYLQN
jgi:hypothetical protein